MDKGIIDGYWCPKCKKLVQIERCYLCWDTFTHCVICGESIDWEDNIHEIKRKDGFKAQEEVPPPCKWKVEGSNPSGAFYI